MIPLGPACQKCKRVLFAEGETAWASDWNVVDHTDRSVRREVRYTCESCEVAG